jgi:L-ascorbate metabolism protein UlaG (beta-lactamase superfamily)
MIEHIHWLGHSSFRINENTGGNGSVIYIDPWRIPEGSPRADLILVSHDHHDHCSPADIARIRTDDTLVIANPRAASVLGMRTEVMRPWQGAMNVGSVSIRAIPAYTIAKAFHASVFEGLGFVISVSRYDIYYAGDTDLIDDMYRTGCDIALLPVGGVFTMNASEAAEAARRVKAKHAVPMHFGTEVPGSSENGRLFCDAVKGDVEGILLPIENPNYS